jgi:hypothetical protein
VLQISTPSLYEILDNNNVYGFIDLDFTLSQNEYGSVQSYIQKKLCDDKKICYLALILTSKNIFSCYSQSLMIDRI